MARTIDEIFNETVSEAQRLANDAGNTDIVNMLANPSKVAVWKIVFYAIAFCVWSLENLWDLFQASINSQIANLVPHTPIWYRNKALAFQYGIPLIPETDKFDNTGFNDAQIDASKVVKYAAVNESEVDGKRVLLIKIATTASDGTLMQLTTAQETAFTAYINAVKDAGNRLVIYNQQADSIKASIRVYYDPQLLDAQGNRLDGLGENPIVAAANNYLLNLDFNGRFSIAKFEDAIRGAYGVSDRNANVTLLQKKTAANVWQNVQDFFIPDAGYAKFETNGLTITYIGDVLN